MPDLRPWQQVKARYESGGAVPLHVRKMAEAVLGETFVRRQRSARGGTPVRPDYLDRQAGDDTFDDDRDGGMVVL